MFGLKTYKIKKGSHYSGYRFFPFFKKKELSSYVCFTDSCRYVSNDNQLTEQINKLFGFGSFFHHRRSYRIGWNYNRLNDEIDLYDYFYYRGERFSYKTGSMKIGEVKKLTIKSTFNVWLGVYLFPYFGGKVPAPHDIDIKLEFVH